MPDMLPALIPIITGGSAVAGTAGNIFEDYKKNQYQNYIMNLMKNPNQLAALVAKLQQPLNNGLTQAVGNQVQGNLAERGLSQAPGVFAASESQALAPYYQQNQNSALQSVLQMLGMPAGSFGSPVNTSGAMSAFMKSLQQQPSGGNWNGQFGVGGITDPSLGQISYMPTPPNGVSYGPDLPPPSLAPDGSF